MSVIYDLEGGYHAKAYTCPPIQAEVDCALSMGDKSKGIFRLRLGIVLFILSWMPIAQALLVVAHNNGKLTSESASNSFRLIVWGIQFLIGFIGIWLAGSIAFKTAKQDGWKQTPKKLWHLFWNGPGEQEVKK